MESQAEENIVVPEQMSVGELRQWLAQFGEENRAHYEQNRVQKAGAASLQQKIQHLEHPVSSTSSTASTSSRETLGAPRNRSTKVEHAGDEDVDDFAELLAKHAQPESSESGIELVPVISQDDSLFQSLEASEKDEKVEFDMDSKDPKHNPNYHQDSKSDRDYQAVSIQKLLEVPKPMNRQNPGSEWDEFLDDDFSDSSTSHRKLSTFVWYPSNDPKEETAAASSHPAEEGSVGSVYDETLSVSSVLTGHQKKSTIDNESDDVLSFKPRSSVRNLRARLPQLLCKPGKGDEEVKMVQRTYHNRPKSPPPSKQSTFHSVSPHPNSSAFLHSRMPANEAPEDSNHRNDDADTTMSCPDFAAASAFLHKFAENRHEEADKEQVPTTRERSRRRHRRSHRSGRKEEERYGTSAILPGAVNASLGQVFVIEDDMEMPGSKVSHSMNNDYRRSCASSSRRSSKQSTRDSASLVSETVSKFGGCYRRESAPSAVQQRQEELEKRLAMKNQKVQHVRKIRWEANTSGSYKRTVRVEPSE